LHNHKVAFKSKVVWHNRYIPQRRNRRPSSLYKVAY